MKKRSRKTIKKQSKKTLKTKKTLKKRSRKTAAERGAEYLEEFFTEFKEKKKITHCCGIPLFTAEQWNSQWVGSTTCPVCGKEYTMMLMIPSLEKIVVDETELKPC